MSEYTKDAGGWDRLEEIRQNIARYAPMVDTPADRYAHNIVSIDLSMIAEEFGVATANEVIEDFDLEALGWPKHDVAETEGDNG